MEPMTLDVFLAVGKIAGLAFIIGYFATLGMWVVCKMSGWAPVNIAVNVDRAD